MSFTLGSTAVTNREGLPRLGFGLLVQRAALGMSFTLGSTAVTDREGLPRLGVTLVLNTLRSMCYYPPRYVCGCAAVGADLGLGDRSFRQRIAFRPCCGRQAGQCQHAGQHQR